MSSHLPHGCYVILRHRQPKAAPSGYSWHVSVRAALSVPLCMAHLCPPMPLIAGKGRVGGATGCPSALVAPTEIASPTLMSSAAEGVPISLLLLCHGAMLLKFSQVTGHMVGRAVLFHSLSLTPKLQSLALLTRHLCLLRGSPSFSVCFNLLSPGRSHGLPSRVVPCCTKAGIPLGRSSTGKICCQDVLHPLCGNGHKKQEALYPKSILCGLR